MKPQIATIPEQSVRLLACGVKHETADMCYSSGALSLMEYRYEIKDRDGRRESYEIIPAWSLSRLLDLLPNRVLVVDAWYEFQICKCPFGYEVRYHSDIFKDPFGCLCKEPIEGCIEAIKWLKNNGYSLNNIEQ